MADLNNPCFEDMKLQVGARLQLMLTGSPKIVYYSSLIGWVTGEYLLVKIPIANGLSVPMQEGAQVILRVFSGVAVFTFQCAIESILLAPRYYMHLRFPSTIKATPLRETMRVKVSLPVEIRGAAAEAKTATLSDLSISGAFVTADDKLGEPGDTISVAFAFHVQPTNQEVRIETDATIRSSRELAENGKPDGAPASRHGVGIHFNSIAPSEQVMLQNFLYEADSQQHQHH